jgi:hypothetical protein
MDGLRRFGRGPRRRRKRRVHLRCPQQVQRLRSAGIRVLLGRFEEFFGPDVVLMWLHLAHPGLCGARTAGQLLHPPEVGCSGRLVDHCSLDRSRSPEHAADPHLPYPQTGSRCLFALPRRRSGLPSPNTVAAPLGSTMERAADDGSQTTRADLRSGVVAPTKRVPVALTRQEAD